jgi:hypothetical protein
VLRFRNRKCPSTQLSRRTRENLHLKTEIVVDKGKVLGGVVADPDQEEVEGEVVAERVRRANYLKLPIHRCIFVISVLYSLFGLRL